mmetsp:Transcript_38147/g.110131  ORF Transcript_38147/g.110131 Transcript_38147/m.110131 type:complete len:292 (-) Transcript_38147:318-1193(-)
MVGLGPTAGTGIHGMPQGSSGRLGEWLHSRHCCGCPACRARMRRCTSATTSARSAICSTTAVSGTASNAMLGMSCGSTAASLSARPGNTDMATSARTAPATASDVLAGLLMNARSVHLTTALISEAFVSGTASMDSIPRLLGMSATSATLTARPALRELQSRVLPATLGMPCVCWSRGRGQASACRTAGKAFSATRRATAAAFSAQSTASIASLLTIASSASRVPACSEESATWCPRRSRTRQLTSRRTSHQELALRGTLPWGRIGTFLWELGVSRETCRRWAQGSRDGMR